MTIKDFRTIDFGYASAEQEGARAPNLLVDGYIDIRHVCEQALNGDDFLILGYKGSGKSAVAERLRITHEGDSQLFLTNINLEDFPYASFSQIVQENVAPEAKYPTAWSWILLIYLLASYEKDAGASHGEPEAFRQTMLALREMGLTPISGLPRLVRSTTKQTFKLTIPKIFERTWESNDAYTDIPNYVDNLKNLVRDLRSESKHLLIIDGLDEIVTSEAAQWDSLGALVFEVNRLNMLFLKNSVSAKIILLCRTDIFELLAGANKNKIRQDSCVELDWYADPSAPGDSMLVKIANLRASVAFGEKTDLLSEFFPKKTFGRPTMKVLLDTTRHTPRDFLQLLKYIQGCCTDDSISSENVKSGMRMYSIEYFLPEMIDELEGYATANEAKEFFHLVGSLRSREFSAKQIYEVLEKEKSSLRKDQVDVILRALFECSAIGNVQHRGSGGRFLTYRFRNRHATFNMKEKLMLHRGLWRALNLPVDPTWENELPADEPPPNPAAQGTLRDDAAPHP